MLETLFNKIEYVIADKGEFVFPIPFLHPHNIRCYVLIGHGVKKLKIEEDFTVEKKDNYRDGAIITLREAAHYAGKTLIIARIMLITQDLSLPYYSKIPSPSLERQMDKTIMICQQLREMLSRAILVPPGVNPNWEALLELLTQAAADAKDAADRAQDILDQILDIPWDKYAPLESPHFTGVPTAPTAGKGTNTDQLATTAFVQQEIEDFLVSVKVSFTQSQWLSIEEEAKTASGEERKILEAALLEAEAGGTKKYTKMFRIVTEMTDYSHVYKLVKVSETTEGDAAEGDTAESSSVSKALAMRKVAEIAEDGKVSSVDGNYAVECCEDVEVRVMDKGYIMLLAAEGFDGYIYTLGKRLPVEYNYSKVTGGVAITGIKTNRAHWTDLTIPSSIQEGEEVLPVVEIGANAFAGNTVITSVVIGEGCKVIRTYAFSYCTSLKKLVLPSSMRELYSNFLYGASQLKELTLNEGLATIHAQAFHASALTSLHIPASVTLIEEGAFVSLSCPYTVAEGNEKYMAEDGCLYTKDGKTFLRYGHKSTATTDNSNNAECKVKDGCEIIGVEAITHIYLKSVTLPAGLKEIHSAAFFRLDCDTMVLPNTLEKIAPDAFRCNLKTLTMSNGSGSDGGSSGTGNNNGRFSLEQGILYDNTDKVLLKCPTEAEALKNGNTGTAAAEIIEADATQEANDHNGNVKVKDDITSLGSGAFQYCTMASLDLNQVETLRNDSISAIHVTTLTIGKALKTWSENGNITLTTLTVCSDNPNFTAGDNGDANVLFSKDKTVLYMFPANKGAKGSDSGGSNGSNGSYMVPESVKEIGISAIYNNTHLASLDLKNVTRLHLHAAASLSNLATLTLGNKLETVDSFGCELLAKITSLTFPATVKHLANSAFNSLSTLNEVTFQGTGKWTMQGAFSNCPKLFTIKGHKDSSAEDYANSNNLMFVDMDAEKKK